MKKHKKKHSQVEYNQNITRIVKSRDMTLVSKAQELGCEKSIIIFGSFKLSYKPSKPAHKSYKLFRLKQISLTDSEWIVMRGRLRRDFLDNLRPYYIAGNSTPWITTLQDLAFRHLYYDLRRIIPTEQQPYLRNESRRFNGGMYSKGWLNGDKVLSAFLRNILDKNVVSLFLKVTRWSFTQLSMAQYLEFMQKYVITGDCGSLYPLLSHCYDGSECDGSNQWFASRIDWLTRGDIKLLRKSPPTLVAYGDSHSSKLLMSILRNPLRKFFPVKILADILRRYEGAWYEQGEIADVSHFCIVDKWLRHHCDVWRKHGYKNYLTEWRALKNQLFHAIDWLFAVRTQIHKNQNWLAIYRQVQQWDTEVKNKSLLTWEPVIRESLTVDGVLFSELTSSDELYEEGSVMHHCVYDYSNYCKSNVYRVFQVKSESERATLGVTINKGKHELHQIHSYCNEEVSSLLLRSAEKFVNQLNVLLKGETNEFAR